MSDQRTKPMPPPLPFPKPSAETMIVHLRDEMREGFRQVAARSDERHDLLRREMREGFLDVADRHVELQTGLSRLSERVDGHSNRPPPPPAPDPRLDALEKKLDENTAVTREALDISKQVLAHPKVKALGWALLGLAMAGIGYLTHLLEASK